MGIASMKGPLALKGKSLGIESENKLLFLFAIPFVCRVVDRIFVSAKLAGRDFTLDDSYDISEWAINYSGGFIRRGLTGSLMHWIHQSWSVNLNFLVVCVTTALFICFCTYLWRQSSETVPRWVLFTTPLMAYPVYVEDVFLRKDILMLLVFAVCVKILFNKKRSPMLMATMALILSAGILSHELLAFFALPLILVTAVVIRRVKTSNQHPSGLWEGNGGPKFTNSAFLSIVFLLFPIANFLMVLVYKGSNEQAVLIAESWRGAMSPSTGVIEVGGALGWLGSGLDAIGWGALSELYFGIPYWVIVAFTTLTGVVLISSALMEKSKDHAKLFIVVSFFQLIAMAPIFILALDQGRWVIISLLSSFIFTIESTRDFREWILARIWFPPKACQFNIPHWGLPIGFAFWGIPHYLWSPYGWLSSSPFGLLLRIYFYMRKWGMPHPRDLFNVFVAN